MKNRIVLFAAAALIAAGCSVEQEIAPVGTSGKHILHATAESDGTKAAISKAGAFTWHDDDAIAVINADASENGIYEASTGGSSSTDFDYYSGNVVASPAYAFYPADIYDSFSVTTATIVLPDDYDLDGGSFAEVPMAAKAVGDNLPFKHLGGMIRVDLGTVPAGVKEFLVWFPGKKVNGSFDVDLSAADPVIATTGSSDPGEEGLNFGYSSPLASPADVVLYVPLPVGTYDSGMRVNMYDNGKCISDFVYSSPITIVRKKMYRVEGYNVGEIVKVSNGTGSVTVPNTTRGVVLDFSEVDDSGDYTLSYAGSDKPAKVYISGIPSTEVGALSGDLSSSTVEILGGVFSSTSIKTAASTLIIREGAAVETVNIEQGNAVIEGNVDQVNVYAPVNVKVSSPGVSVDLATGSSGATVTAEGEEGVVGITVSSDEPGFIANVVANDGGTVVILSAGANVTINDSTDGEPGSEVVQPARYTRVTSYDQLTVGSQVIIVSDTYAMGVGEVGCEYIDGVDIGFTDSSHDVAVVFPGAGADVFTLAKQSVTIDEFDYEAMSMLGTNGYLDADPVNDNTLTISTSTSDDTALGVWIDEEFSDLYALSDGDYGHILLDEDKFVASDHGEETWLYKLEGSGTAEKIFTTYTVTFDGNGADGGEAPAPVSVLKNNSILDYIPYYTLYKTGYMLSGWNTAADGKGDAYVPDEPFEVTGDLTLYAQWVSGAHEITVNYNDSSLGTVSLSTSNWLIPGKEVEIYTNRASETVLLTGLTYTPEGGDPVDILSEMSFEMPDSDVTINVTWVQGYKLTVSKTGAGASYCNLDVSASTCRWNPLGYFIIPAGETVTLTPDNREYNYMLGSLTWTPSGGDATDITSTKTFTMPASDVTVSAEFVTNQIVFDLTTTDQRTQPSGSTLLTYDHSPENTYVKMVISAGEAVGYTALDTYPTGTYEYTKVYQNNVITVTPASGHSIAKVAISATASYSYDTITNGSAVDRCIYTLTDGTQPLVVTMGGTEAYLYTVTVTMEY